MARPKRPGPGTSCGTIVRMLAPEQLPQPLESIASDLEATGWAAEVCDADWRLVYSTSQLRGILGAGDDAELGIGLHILESRGLPFWLDIIDPETAGDWAAMNVPHMLGDDPGGRDRLAAMALPEIVPIVEAAKPSRLGVWTSLIKLTTLGATLGPIRYFGVRAREPDGTPVATLYLYGSSLPAQLLAMVSRGRVAHFERMARLVEPGRREAAILFADVEASGALSRRLPSSTYFEFIRDFNTSSDDTIINGGGIVGDHVGDGLTAFFVVDDVGSPSRAARAAIEVGRGLQAAIDGAAIVAGLGAGDVRLNVGVHWGGTLYMGQVVTGGRLEVTALGDEVNECARIEETAAGGALLASKALIERLDPDDAAAVGIAPSRVAYQALADLDGAGAKAIRDAGLIAVARVEAPLSNS
jgi:class 3 adenylate cyclase